MTLPPYRRLFGLLLGSLTGLMYGVVSQTVNQMVMPGIPFYLPPFGQAGNILMAAVLGAVLGLACAWAETGFTGVFWSSLLGSLAVVAATLLTGNSDPEFLPRKIAAVIIIFFPTAAVIAPLLILVRWIVNREEAAHLNAVRLDDRNWTPRISFPVGLLLLAGAVGALSLYPDLGRAVTPRMQSLIQEGLQAASMETLPMPLRPPDVDQFLAKANGGYTLQWDKDDTNQFAIPRPATSPFDQSTVIARFENGWWLVCMFPSPTGTPECRDF